MNSKSLKIGGAVAIAAALLLAYTQAGAQTSPTYAGVTITQSGTLVSNTPTAPLAINGQSSCGVSFSGGTSATVVPQGSSDPTSVGQPSSAAWVTASAIGSGSISYTGTTLGVAAAYPGGTAAFRLSPGTVVGTITYSITCGAGVAPGSSSGGGGAITGTVQVSPVPLPVTPPTCAAAPQAPCVQATGPYPWPTDANNNPIHTLYGSTGAQINSGVISGTGVSSSTIGLSVRAFCGAYDGSAFDPCTKDPETHGPLQVDSGGGANNTACTAAASCSVATGNHRLASILITTVGTTGTITCYDNTAASGTVIGGVSAANGTLLFYNVFLDRIAVTGIYCVSATAGPAYTVSYY